MERLGRDDDDGAIEKTPEEIDFFRAQVMRALQAHLFPMTGREDVRRVLTDDPFGRCLVFGVKFDGLKRRYVVEVGLKGVEAEGSEGIYQVPWGFEVMDEMLARLPSDQARAVYVFAARETRDLWLKRLSDSTEGHLNLPHNQYYSTKRDLYDQMYTDAVRLLAEMGEVGV